MFPRYCLFLGAALWLVSGLCGARAADWPQWRGPDRTGHVPAGEPVPATLPTEPKIIWRMKVGEGLASPVVAGGRVFYFDAVEKKETIHSIDAETGKEVWREAVDDTFKDNQGPAGPRCTPMVDGDRVYAQSCKGELQCREFATGKVLWHINYTNEFGATFTGEVGNTPGAGRHGNNGAPLVDGDRLIVNAGGTNGASVLCLDKRTGKVIWKSQNDQAGYAPPVIATLAGVRQVVCFTAEAVIGVAASDGKLLWRIPVKTAFARHVSTPVFFEDYVVVSSHQVGMIGVKVTKTADGQSAEKAWVSKEAAMNFSSPVAVGKYLYGLGPTKNLICVEIPTGKLAWSQDGYFTTSADRAEAGFIVMGKNILVLTDGGEVALFEASPEAFKAVGRVQVCGINWCNPAYADGRLYVRDGVKNTGEMLCVDLLH
ncbi:MAG TPA: PQQ-binding-like beta-propeller repeat protein [Verrucomicrobiae bacterium]|nr:PQQ-binding-like beta-propeller repeat protein [Verrucomicrobiae bacterium]